MALARVETMRRDINRLRRAVKSHDSEATEEAFDKCERWFDQLEPVSGTEMNTCRRCKTPLTPGKAIMQTFRPGTPDFPGDTHAVTFSAGGPGRIADCMKCPKCGWSVTSGDEGRPK